MQRLKSNRNEFATMAVLNSQLPVVVPTPLNAQELELFHQIHSIRSTDEWEGDSTRLLAEYARISVAVDELSLQLSACQFKDRELLEEYTALSKVRDTLRKNLKLNVSSMDIKTRMKQKKAADAIINGLKRPAMSGQPAPKIDWSILDV
jgi:hypothetical protein